MKRLSPSSLAVHSTESIPFKSGISSAFPPDVYPVLTATVNGPLWVAEGEDLSMFSATTGGSESNSTLATRLHPYRRIPRARFYIRVARRSGE